MKRKSQKVDFNLINLIERLSTSNKKLSEKSIKELYDISHQILSLNFDIITIKLLIDKKNSNYYYIKFNNSNIYMKYFK